MLLNYGIHQSVILEEIMVNPLNKSQIFRKSDYLIKVGK